MRLLTFGVASSLTLAVAGCGSVSSAAKEPAAKAVQLQVSAAKFSKQVQITGDEVVFSLMIKNTGSNPAPDVIVQLKGLANKTKYDPQAAVAVRTSPTDLPDDTTHAPWFVETAPGGSPISDSFLYTGGALAPGRTRTLRWQMNVEKPGTHSIDYQVWSGLSDNEAKATSGTGLTGSVTAKILKK